MILAPSALGGLVSPSHYKHSRVWLDWAGYTPRGAVMHAGVSCTLRASPIHYRDGKFDMTLWRNGAKFMVRATK